MPSFAASRRSSGTVIAPAPLPVPFDAPRLRAAALAPSRPRSLRVLLDSLLIVFFWRAPDCAFLTFFRAAWRCFSVAMAISLRSPLLRSAYPAEYGSHGPGRHVSTSEVRKRGGRPMAKDHGSSVKNDKQYEGLRKKGMSKSRAAAISNSEGSSSRGGKSSGSSRSKQSSGSGSSGNKAQKGAAGRKGGKKSS